MTRTSFTNIDHRDSPSKIGPQHRKLKICLLIGDFQELWGPICLLGGNSDAGLILRTERGYIAPLPRLEQNYPELEEVECHWPKYIPYNFKLQDESEEPVLLDSTSRIMIGTDAAEGGGLNVSHTCESTIPRIQQRTACHLQFTGTCKARYIADGFDLQLTGGQYITAGLVKKYKRIPARTLKSQIVEQCRIPDIILLMPLLNLRIGLEVSACTGNSQRTTLWDALRLSQTAADSTKGSSKCQHSIEPMQTSELAVTQPSLYLSLYSLSLFFLPSILTLFQ